MSKFSTFRAVDVKDISKMADKSPSTIRRWLKRTPVPPPSFILPKGRRLYPEPDVQDWLDNVVNRTYPGRTWKRAFAKLRQMILIDRETLLKKLERRQKQPWSKLARKFNRFDDSHVKAYRRGIEDAIAIVKRHGVETYDYVPKIGQRIHVGGCVGIITKMDKKEIVVSGIYTYTYADDREGPPMREAWRFKYSYRRVMNADVRPWWPIAKNLAGKKDDAVSWDYENIARIC